jgi:cell division protease FtsH
MSTDVGAIKLGSSSGEVFLGRDMGHQRDYSEEVASVVDEEVRRLIEAAHDEAWEILVENRGVLDDLVLGLLERETLNKDELGQVFAPVVKRPERPVWLSSARRVVSDIPPVLTPAERTAANGQNNGHAAASTTGVGAMTQSPTQDDDAAGGEPGSTR